MSDVYQGPLCNIAATAANNSLEGCFRKRDPRLVRPCVISTQYTDYAHVNGRYLIEDPDSAIPHENDQPLFRRALVVQELILPSESTAFWE
jgi:hypothetical protein